MGEIFAEDGAAVRWQGGHETVRIEPWAPDSLRVRGRIGGEIIDNLPGALLEPPAAPGARAELTPGLARVVNGQITAEITASGRLRFLRTHDGTELLAEAVPHFSAPAQRRYAPAGLGGGLHRVEVLFSARDGERFYGLGQHQHGKLDQKGAVIELVQRNTEVSIPFLLSSLGYGFLWNHPGIGRVELGTTGTRWVSEASRQWDYWITAAADPASVVCRYTGVTGRPPLLPEWASGFWQSRLRYRTQRELLDVVHEYKRRDLPLSVIVVDYFHWTRQGEWQFDPGEWPDPGAMVAELDRLGVKLMVSIWPTVSPASVNYAEMAELGLLTAAERGVGVHMPFWDKGIDGPAMLSYYDATSPRARDYIWSKVRDGYYKHGVRAWWLDACEPEVRPEQPDNLRYYLGPGLEVANAYPMLHAKGFHDGMTGEGETDVVLLCRSAWAGSQRYGTAVWSGDIGSTFADLRRQIPAGLNIGLSGICWWTTDIGGFSGGDTRDPSFRELLIRWFQFAVFTPLCRLHGFRQPALVSSGADQAGAPNEPWSFGDQAYQIIRRWLRLREHLRPYVMDTMRAAHTEGLPPMRPLFLNFPGDPVCWDMADEFMLGDDLLVAPVVSEGAVEREVYLPAGADWQDAWTGEPLAGGQWLSSPAPLELIPVYVRAGGSIGPFGALDRFACPERPGTLAGSGGPGVTDGDTEGTA
jgi:alpha-D-xyloside xylohydrolase